MSYSILYSSQYFRKALKHLKDLKLIEKVLLGKANTEFIQLQKMEKIMQQNTFMIEP